MLDFLRRDFIKVREALNNSVNFKIPLGIFAIYYIIMLPIGLLMTPFAIIYTNYKVRKILKELEKEFGVE